MVAGAFAGASFVIWSGMRAFDSTAGLIIKISHLFLNAGCNFVRILISSESVLRLPEYLRGLRAVWGHLRGSQARIDDCVLSLRK